MVVFQVVRYRTVTFHFSFKQNNTNLHAFINPTNFPLHCIPSLLFSLYKLLSSTKIFFFFFCISITLFLGFHRPDGPRYLLRFLIFSLSLSHTVFLLFSFLGCFVLRFHYLLSLLRWGRCLLCALKLCVLAKDGIFDVLLVLGSRFYWICLLNQIGVLFCLAFVFVCMCCYIFLLMYEVWFTLLHEEK